MGSHTIVDGYTIMGGYRSVKDDQKCKVTSVAVFPSATAADDVLTTDAKSAAAEVHRAAYQQP